jgi:ABC-type dipeptide/oligopeptide/nickel transport system ATPase component
MEKGEILGVVGESSSGKSLTAKSILNLLPEGLHWEAEKFQVMGLDYLKEDPDKIRSFIGEKIGYIPQTQGITSSNIKIKDQIVMAILYAKDLWKKLWQEPQAGKCSGIRDTTGFEFLTCS